MATGNLVTHIDKIIRNKIFQSSYYKEKCFGLNASTIIDRAVELKSIGGTYGGTLKPSPFLCLLFKLLQINPDIEIIYKYVESDYKYLKALGAVYIRLVCPALTIYTRLEALLNEYARLKFRNPDTSLSVIHIDEFADNLLRKEVYLGLTLPHLPKRFVLEEHEGLPPRKSALDDELVFEEVEEPLPEVLEKPRKKPKPAPKEPAPDSLEYWNKLRQDMGLPPLKPKPT